MNEVNEVRIKIAVLAMDKQMRLVDSYPLADAILDIEVERECPECKGYGNYGCDPDYLNCKKCQGIGTIKIKLRDLL